MFPGWLHIMSNVFLEGNEMEASAAQQWDIDDFIFADEEESVSGR